MVGREAEHAVPRFDRAVGGVDGFDDADHFMARFADWRWIMVVGQVMDMTDIAAAEGQAQCFDDGGARLQGGLRRINELALTAGDNLNGFHLTGSPAGSRHNGEQYSSFALIGHAAVGTCFRLEWAHEIIGEPFVARAAGACAGGLRAGARVEAHDRAAPKA